MHQNNPGSVASYDTRPGNEADLFYNAPEPTRGRSGNFGKFLMNIAYRVYSAKCAISTAPQVVDCTTGNKNSALR